MKKLEENLRLIKYEDEDEQKQHKELINKYEEIKKEIGNKRYVDNSLTYIIPDITRDIYNKLNMDTKILCFNNGLCYDERTNDYRKITRDDTTTLTTNIKAPIKENIKPEKIEEVKTIINSIYEDDELTYFYFQSTADFFQIHTRRDLF